MSEGWRLPAEPARGQRGWSLTKFALAGLGVVTIVLAIFVLSIASPSPHLYVELFLGLPLVWLGLGMLALGIVLQGRHFVLAIRIAAWALLAVVIGTSILGILWWLRVTS